MSPKLSTERQLLRRKYGNRMLDRLEKLKERLGSWNKVCAELGLHKKTVMRWRAKRKISRSYLELLVAELKKRGY